MSKPVSITIPDDLYERLQKVKSNISISGECQEALERAVHIQELLTERIKTMENRMEVLSAQKEKYDQQYFDQGHEDGVKDCEGRLDYEEIVELSNCQDVYKTETWSQWLEDDVKDVEKLDDAGAFDYDKYLEGYVEAVKEYFEQIRHNL